MDNDLDTETASGVRYGWVGLVFLLGVLLASPGFPEPEDARLWVRKDSYGDFAIVAGESPSETVSFAASELQRFWERSTGYLPAITAAPIPGKVTIWLGHDGNPHVSGDDVADLGNDGLLIRTNDSVAGNRRSNLRRRIRDGQYRESTWLVITGKTDRGTLYGVYEFLREYLGVRWFSPDVIHIAPQPDFLPEIDHRYVPPFAYRDVSARVFTHAPGFAAIHGLNGMWSGVPARLGGHVGYVGGKSAFGHTFHHFVSPGEYFDAHPEYFSEVDGVRVRDSQLCLTNPDVLAITIGKVLAMLRRSPPSDRIVSVSQMDRGLWCTCDTCRAVDKAERSHSGSIVRFVNRVAEAIEGEFPGAFVDTFAYVYSRRPPKRVKPRDNVIVRLCAIEADYSTPLSDPTSERNSAFAQDLRGWGKITKNLYVWDYTLNWHSHLGPHPNLPVLQPNALFFADAGVSGVYEQASPVSPHTDFEHLKAYILARCLWNPTVDWRVLRDEFLPSFYGAAAPFIREYLELLAKRVGGDDVILTMANTMEWMDYDMVVAAQDIFRRALEATPEGAHRARLRRAQLPVLYAALVCPPKVKIGASEYLLTRPQSLTFDEFWETLKQYGVTHYTDYPIEAFRKAMDGQTPPRRQRIRFEVLANERISAWVVPSMEGMLARLHDKRTGVEAVPRYEDILARPRRPSAWNQANYAAGAESVSTLPYSVVERGGHTLALEAVLPNGLAERRRFSLDGERGALRVTMEYTNPSNTALSIPSVSLAPYAVAEDSPRRIWIRNGKRWKRRKVSEDGSVPISLGDSGERGSVEWAVRVAGGAYIVNRAAAAGIQGLRTTFYQFQGEDFAEAWLALAPVQPDETRTVILEMRSSTTLD